MSNSATEAPGEVLLDCRRLYKQFDGVTVLSEVDFTLRAGEVHVLLGQNGAGKSTFIKMLSGAYQRDGGEVFLAGRPFRPASPLDSLRAGIATIYQEFSLVPDLTIAQNIFLGHEPRKGPFIDSKTMSRRTQEVLDRMGLDLRSDQKVGSLAVGERQAVEITKALAHQCRVLILDEPTAALTGRETHHLFQFIRRLKQQGVGLIYVSHRLQEVAVIGDRVTVFRDGRVTGRVPATTPVPELTQLMTGRAASTEEFAPAAPGPEALRTEGLTTKGVFSEISLTIRQGEVVGLAGLVGSGRSELVQTLFGVARPDRGQIHVGGKAVRIRNPRQAIARGMALLPNDRARSGLCLPLPVQENALHASLDQQFRAGWLTAARERKAVQPHLDSLKVSPPDPTRVVRLLSGGNQQKVVLAKWLATKARILLFDEPTRGVDVGVKAEMYRLMRQLAAKGAAVLVTSSDAEELAGLCDRVIIMVGGRITAEYRHGEVTSDEIVNAISGGEAAWRA